MTNARAVAVKAPARVREENRTIYRAVRILERRLGKRGVTIKEASCVRNFLRLRLTGLDVEIFAALFLDTHHRLIAWEELARGTIDQASVYPREVVKAALRHGAAAVIFAHNHPSGITEPSVADRQLTNKLKSALALLEIRVLDHFIVGSGVPVSLAERGLL